MPVLKPLRYAVGLVLGMALWGTAFAAPPPSTPYDTINKATAASPITVHRLRGGVSMLEGSGGNIAVLQGPDGLLMVDCGIAISQQKIEDALHGLSPGPLRYAILTHWHWDHADGDGWVRRQGAQLLASGNTIRHLSQTIRVAEWGHTFPPVRRADRPNVALDGPQTLRFDGENVRIRPYVPSHTDGDLSVAFQQADVLATGDTFWNGVYPFIDYVGGGGVDGMIGAAEANLKMASSHTVVIPGHGPVGNRADLVAFRDMLVDIREKVSALKAKGLSLAQVQAARPTAAYDAKWGTSIINGALFTALVYRGV